MKNIFTPCFIGSSVCDVAARHAFAPMFLGVNTFLTPVFIGLLAFQAVKIGVFVKLGEVRLIKCPYCLGINLGKKRG